MSYTKGNWTIEPPYNDSISTPKSLSIPDMAWATDFSVGGTGSLTGDKTTVLTNVTGDNLIAQEVVELAHSRQNNVYSNTPIPTGLSAGIRSGRKVAVKDTVMYSATNSVSGEEILFPMTGWHVFIVPDLNLVPESLISDFVARQTALLYPTGGTGATLLKNLLRGDTNPTA
jgi:hypothetical protein